MRHRASVQVMVGTLENALENYISPGVGSAGAARAVIACFADVIGSHQPKRVWHVMLLVAAVAALVLRTLTTGIGGQAGSRSAGASGRPTSARIRWLIASVIPKVSH